MCALNVHKSLPLFLLHLFWHLRKFGFLSSKFCTYRSNLGYVHKLCIFRTSLLWEIIDDVDDQKVIHCIVGVTIGWRKQPESSMGHPACMEDRARTANT